MIQAGRPSIIDREREIAELRRLADRARPGLAIVYGRRRVGKTYLLSHTWPDRRVFYFLAADLPAERNRAELLSELSTWLGRPLDTQDYPTWRTIFRFLVDLSVREPLIVILDEFQYLQRDPGDDAASQLVAVWDREAPGRALTLVLCGSEVATMRALQSGDQPLYGRANWSARIHPFDYQDAARMAPHLRPREAVALYGIFGGTPRYLATIEPAESIRDTAVRTFLSPRGEVHLQLQTLIEQEKGIREQAEYRAVLAAIAGGATDLNEIVQQSGTGLQPQSIRKILTTLEDLDLVERERNFGARETAPYRYHIADNAVGFWYRFVFPHRSRLETGDPDEAWGEFVAPHLAGYLGRVFERVVRQAYDRHHQAWELPALREWARWEGKDRDRRSVEIDIVAQDNRGRILTGEVKWSSAPIDADVHSEFRRKLERLAGSGQGWAAEATKPSMSLGHLYVSAAGFGDAFRRLAEADETVKLLTLEQLYLVPGADRTEDQDSQRDNGLTD